MFGLRSNARESAPSATRVSGLIAAVAAAALLSSGCAQGSSSSQDTDSAAAVSSTDASSTDPAEADSTTAEGDADDGEDSAAEPEHLLTEREIGQILLSESDLPFTPDTHSMMTGVDFFEDQLGAEDDTYTESFGTNECTSAMDRINSDLVGESPQGGVVQEYTHELEDRTESLYVWMLGLEDAADSSLIWDAVIDACMDEPLQSETDTVSFEAFQAEGFRGIELEMDVHNGESMVEVLGFSASQDFGRHLLMVSAANMEADTFREIVESQAEKLTSFQQRAE